MSNTAAIDQPKHWIIAHNDRESGSLADLHIEHTEEAAKKRFAACAAFLYDVSTASAFVVEGQQQPRRVAYAYEGNDAYGEWFDAGGRLALEPDENWYQPQADGSYLSWHSLPLETIDLGF